jgi:hypothetical protein
VSVCDDDPPEGRPTPDMCGEQRRNNLACCRGGLSDEGRPRSLSCPAGCRLVDLPWPCGDLPNVSNRSELRQDSEAGPAEPRLLAALRRGLLSNGHYSGRGYRPLITATQRDISHRERRMSPSGGISRKPAAVEGPRVHARLRRHVPLRRFREASCPPIGPIPMSAIGILVTVR